MPNHTEHYNLIKPIKTETYNIDDVTNTNADTIDNALYQKINRADNAKANNIPILTAEGNIIDSGKNMVDIANAFMVTTLPEPSETYNNICYMYIGDSVGELEPNNFYKCIFDTAIQKYKWSKIALIGINHIPVETVEDIPIYQNSSYTTEDN